MKCAFVLALSCGTLLAASYAQDEGSDEPSGRARRGSPDVVANIMAVIRKLADLVVPEPDARDNLHQALDSVTTCLREAEGLELDYIREFIAGVPKALDCVGMVFTARNKRQQKKAAQCFVKKILTFQKVHNVPMDQVQKVANSIRVTLVLSDVP
ncbi:hypothetical protein HPB52_002116 [Rhipicephalus sanguineus]|uniref:Secreted protein n=1 Tax=Rhipicephalus sanguineus TaxID=34632 RepID=A0A9D4QBP8_RHISA|nr:hypothetical protein HPB52_002116 [Rhipicephalus sanguineus]